MLSEFLSSLSVDSVEEKVYKFNSFKKYLLEENQKFNLTAITDEREIDRKHFVDSLAAFPYIRGKVLDIGSGAGFPSVPLAILSPQNSFTLIDSLHKRVEFLNRVIELLSLSHCTAVHTRIEDFAKKGEYDTVLARAVARLNTLCEYALPFLKVGGIFIAYKTHGPDLDGEIKEAQNALSVLGGEIKSVIKVKSEPIKDLNHALVLIRKTKETPLRYPRKQNKPKTQPLS